MFQSFRLPQPLSSNARNRLFAPRGRGVVAAVAVLCVASSAGAQSSSSKMEALRAACSDDAARLCSGVQSGGGRVVACLKQHQDELSNGCRQAAGLPAKPVTAPATQPAPAPTPAASMDSSAAGSDTSGSGDAGSGAAASGSVPSLIGQPTHVAGETFVRRTINDPAHGNAWAATVHVPEKWTLDGKVTWHYDQPENPVTLSVHATNPANAEALMLYPMMHMEWTEVAPQYRQYLRGQQSQAGARGADGMVSMPPKPPMQALVNFVKQTRPGVTNLKFVGQQDLPDLAKALKMDPWPGDHGVAVKISYDLDGKPVEEAFFGVYYLSSGGNEAKAVGQQHMAANMIKQTNWGFRELQSFRAPAGKLDQRMAVFCLISKSIVFNPQWMQLSRQVHEQLVAAVNQKVQQGYDQIRAGQAAMQQMQAQEKATDASVASFDAGLRKPFDDSWLRTSGGGSGSGGKLSSTDHESNLLRGEETVNDPSTGDTKQLSNAGDYHFTDGYGNYRTSDDPNYTPEKAGESGSWTPMTVAQ